MALVSELFVVIAPETNPDTLDLFKIKFIEPFFTDIALPFFVSGLFV